MPHYVNEKVKHDRVYQILTIINTQFKQSVSGKQVHVNLMNLISLGVTVFCCKYHFLCRHCHYICSDSSNVL